MQVNRDRGGNFLHDLPLRIAILKYNARRYQGYARYGIPQYLGNHHIQNPEVDHQGNSSMAKKIESNKSKPDMGSLEG